MTLPRLLMTPGPKAVIVAHPDDETMWCGALPVAVPGDWTVICCSIPRRDPERAWHFFSACEVLGAKGYVVPVTETGPDSPLEQKALNLINLARFVCVVTHNAEGEYGHLHHKQVHAFVREAAPGKMVTFGFGSKRPDPYALEISSAAYSTKMRALRCYVSGDPPKWQALLERYRPMGYDPTIERYHVGV